MLPSIDVEIAADRVNEMFVASGVQVANIDTKELGLYLSLNRTRAQLTACGLAQYCPRRRSDKGRPPTMTGCALNMKTQKRHRPWEKPENDKPSDAVIKRMLGEALGVAVRYIMRNHIYMFNKEARRQKKGGPIGLGLTGDVAQVLMCWWDMKVIERLNERGMEVIMYKRYVDDINMVLRKRWGNDDHGSEHLDKKNMDFVQEIANEVLPSIQVTTDYPSKNTNKKMPILDLRVWMEAQFDQVTHEVSVYVIHEYYSKEVSSKAVIDARSAVSWKMKRTVLTQEIVRILRNCSKRLAWSEVCKHVEEYSMRMQFSGYSEIFRAQVVKSALCAYDRMVERDRTGEEPLYRPREWRRVERAEERRKKKSDWFKGAEENESVIFIPSTPRGELKKMFLESIRKAGVRIAVAEVPGRNVKRRVQRSDPFQDNVCEDKDKCMICKNENGRGMCRRTGVTYEVECKECGERYIGETSRNGYTRGREHMEDIVRKNKESPLVVHGEEKHGRVRLEDYVMKVTGMYGEDATKRQIAEAITIQHNQGSALINRQDEWRQMKLPRIQMYL